MVTAFIIVEGKRRGFKISLAVPACPSGKGRLEVC
jgi:hypothetical protein